MGVHGVGRGRRHVPLTPLLAYLPRDARDGGLHVGPPALGLLETLQAGLAEVCVLGDGADRVEVALDIPGNALAVAPHTALQVDTVGGVADGAEALGDRLALSGEALGLVASRFHVLRHLLQARCRLWGTTWTTLCRLAVGVVEGLLHLRERLFRLGGGHRG